MTTLQTTSDWLAARARIIAYIFALISLGSLSLLIVFGRVVGSFDQIKIPFFGVEDGSQKVIQMGVAELLGATAGICALLFAFFWLVAIIFRSPKRRVLH
jgi:hypothetical protein